VKPLERGFGGRRAVLPLDVAAPVPSLVLSKEVGVGGSERVEC
jgi:hypothetical protein